MYGCVIGKCKSQSPPSPRNYCATGLARNFQYSFEHLFAMTLLVTITQHILMTTSTLTKLSTIPRGRAFQMPHAPRDCAHIEAFHLYLCDWMFTEQLHSFDTQRFHLEQAGFVFHVFRGSQLSTSNKNNLFPPKPMSMTTPTELQLLNRSTWTGTEYDVRSVHTL